MTSPNPGDNAHAPLSAAQRTAIISWIESRGVSADTLLSYLRTVPVGGIPNHPENIPKLTTLDVYINAGHAYWATIVDYALLSYAKNVEKTGKGLPNIPSGIPAVTAGVGGALNTILGAIGLKGGIVQIGEILVGLIIVGVAVNAMMKGKR